MNSFKKLTMFLTLMMAFALSSHAGQVMQCDPNATGSTMYPNVVCDSSGKLVTTSTTAPSSGTTTSRSGSITTGGSNQTLASTNLNRKYIFIQNTSSGNLYVNFTNAATTTGNSITLVPNASFVMENGFVTTEAIQIIGATTGQTFVAKEF